MSEVIHLRQIYADEARCNCRIRWHLTASPSRVTCGRCRNIMERLRKPKRTLTLQQHRVYKFIVDHWAKYEVAPTFEEIAQHFGLKSVSTVSEHISSLEVKGWIERGEKYETRAIKPLSPLGCALCGARS